MEELFSECTMTTYGFIKWLSSLNLIAATVIMCICLQDFPDIN